MSLPSLDGTGGNSYRPHAANPKRNKSKVNVEAQNKTAAPALPSSLQYQRLLRGKNHKANVAPMSKAAVMRSTMASADYHRAMWEMLGASDRHLGSYVPQGLKPARFLGLFGTTEVVPCYKASARLDNKDPRFG